MGRRSRTRRPNTKTPLTTVSCTSLELAAGSENAQANYGKIMTALRAGSYIGVDGKYYISNVSGSDSTLQNAVFDKLTDDAELVFVGGTFFTLTGSTAAAKSVGLLRDIKISGVAEGGTKIFVASATGTTPIYNRITIEDCDISGELRLITGSVASSWDYDTYPCRMDISIENNNVHDAWSPLAPRLSSLEQVPGRFNIKNNRVKNFGYVFFYETAQEAALRNMIDLVMEDNTAVCDDDYDVQSTYSGSAPLYHCFAVAEGGRCEMRRNYFEGFHVFDTTTGCYDNYLNFHTIVNENNIWRNIVNFTEGHTYCNIIEDQYALPYGGIPTSQIHRYNTYIVEASYADRFGKDRALLWKYLHSASEAGGSLHDYYTFEHNKLYLYDLRWNHSQQKARYLYKFNANDIVVQQHDKSVAQAMFRNHEITSLTWPERELIFTDNNYRNYGVTAGSEVFDIFINQVTDHDSDNTMVTITGNNIEGYGISATDDTEAELINKFDPGDAAHNALHMTVSGNAITVLPAA